MKQLGQFAVIGCILFMVAMLYDGIYILDEGKQAMVITRFGAPVGKPVTKAGPYLKVPFLQKVQFFEKKILVCDGEPNQIPTNDKTYIYLDTTARWRISNALKFLQAVRTEQRAQSLLSDIVDGTVRDFVNKNKLIEIIRSSDWSTDTMSASTPLANLGKRPKTGRDAITQKIREVASELTPQYGIELVDVMIKRVNYIDSVRRKVYDRMISERKRIAAEKRSLGEGEKAKILGTVERTLQEITSNANKQALEIRGKADAEATRIYGAAYSQDPSFYRFQKTLESYATIIGSNSNLILSADSDLYKYLGSINEGAVESVITTNASALPHVKKGKEKNLNPTPKVKTNTAAIEIESKDTQTGETADKTETNSKSIEGKPSIKETMEENSNSIKSSE